MKSQVASPTHRTVQAPSTPQKATQSISHKEAQRILYALMIPGMLMPVASSMSRVALPVIRDEFAISADMTAWVAAVFTLPFVIVMPVYGRLSDGVGRRRLILAGIGVFSIGTLMTIFAPTLAWLMAGRAIQGIGVSGMMPLGMALLSVIFPPAARGKALGTWSSVGPFTAFFGPLVAGLLIAGWGWRAAFVPPLLFGVLAFVAVRNVVPAGLSTIRPRFLRSFDWIGVALMAITLTSLLFFLSSRPITGREPLQDWRLGLVTLIGLLAFLQRELRHDDPFIALNIFRHSQFDIASLGAMTRMFVMSGASFLMPLYLVDIHGLSAAELGGMLMIMPGAMALMVRMGGSLADRWGSRLPVSFGFLVQGLVMLGFWQLPGTAPLWQTALLLAVHGLGAGLMLAALHSAALNGMSDDQMGVAAGVYSMIRFIGMAVGTALAGVLLENFLRSTGIPINAYQTTFLFFAGGSALGLLFGVCLQRAG